MGLILWGNNVIDENYTRIVFRFKLYQLLQTVISLFIFSSSYLRAESNEFVLPTITMDNIGHLSTAVNIYVSQFHFIGNSVFPNDELAEITKAYTRRIVSSVELEHVRQILSDHFINQGYVNTVITLPDQPVVDGTIKFHIRIGGLAHVFVSGNKRLKPDHIIKRIKKGIGPQLNINRLRQNLELLQYDPNIEKINAQLFKHKNVESSFLDVIISEKYPLSLSMEINNYRAPTIGAERLRLHASHSNLTGISDTLALEYGLTAGDIEDTDISNVDDIDLTYSFPITDSDALLSLRYSKKDSLIIEKPFRKLDIESELENYSLTLSYPLKKSLNQHLILSLSLEHRQNKTIIKSLDLPLSIFTTGSVHSKTKLTVIRFVQEYLHQTLKSQVIVRSTISLGVDAFHPTKIKGTTRDGQFTSWLGQYQYIRRIGNSANQFIFRSNFQWTDDELLSLEQFSVGGYSSVRGYRENQLVRDRAFLSSIEIRLPILFNKSGKEIVQIAPFYNFGRATNNGSDFSEFNDISSIGIGFLTNPLRNLKMELYWGYPLRDVDTKNSDLQDYGIHFSIQLGLFDN